MSPPLHVEDIGEDEGPADPNCLHCYLGEAIEAWSNAHPEKGLDEMLLEVAEVLGEMAASDGAEKDAREFASSVNQLCAHVHGCALQMRQWIARKLAKDAAAKMTH